MRDTAHIYQYTHGGPLSGDISTAVGVIYFASHDVVILTQVMRPRNSGVLATMQLHISSDIYKNIGQPFGDGGEGNSDIEAAPPL